MANHMAIENPEKVSKDKFELLAHLQNMDVSDETWTDLRRLIVSYFAARTTHAANTVAEEKRWTDEDFERMAHTHMQTPYVE